MSLKHLLNHDDDTTEYAQRRQLQGWDDYGVPVDVVPILGDTSWDACYSELIDLQCPPNILSQEEYDYSTQQAVLGCVPKVTPIGEDEPFQEWVEDTIPSEVTPSSAPDYEDDTICFGLVSRTCVKLVGDMSTVDSRLASGMSCPIPGHYQMSVSKLEDRFVITFEDGTPLGEVNAQLEAALTNIEMQHHRVDLEVFAPIRPIREQISRAMKDKDAVVRVNINIYGPRSIFRAIGLELSALKIYLQLPDYVKPGIVYDNPHTLKLPNIESESENRTFHLEAGSQSEHESQKQGEFQQTLDKIYSSLTRGDTLACLEGDSRLKTKLLKHQRQALHFMAQRENGPIPDKFRLWKPEKQDGRTCQRHVITNNIHSMDYPEIGGGILADEMGMGKSLSILALILRTLEDGHKWASQGMTHNNAFQLKSNRRTRATLIVASSDLMINEWFQEMRHHFHEQVRNALTIIKYHGRNRETNLDMLCDADIIVTTYHTLHADSNLKRGRAPMHDLEWYRLVIDEAHIIRRMQTVLYNTVAKIEARSRWCLSGTPIQNRLEDVGSLLAFIRIFPFRNPSSFSKAIVKPFNEGGKRREVAISRFTQLLDSLCLRRTKDLLHLPQEHAEVRCIQLSPEERSQYEHTRKIMVRAAKNQAGSIQQNGALGLFQVQLQLRILCNHGTYQQQFSWQRNRLDEREAIEAWHGRTGEVTCSACNETLPLLGAGSMFRRFDNQCSHILCSECVDESMSESQMDDASYCPLCATLCRMPHPSTKCRSVKEDIRYFRDHGRSSKMTALMADVTSDVWSTKSIIFSCWTHTLDLIGTYLQGAGVTYRRIDGDCPTSKREKTLAEFAHNDELHVLIMTTGTGAVGLNLATANRVYLVEPQWNPSVENQAIARAIRIGQENPVQVIRYVVENTVEQDMQSLQEKKRELASMPWK